VLCECVLVVWGQKSEEGEINLTKTGGLEGGVLEYPHLTPPSLSTSLTTLSLLRMNPLLEGRGWERERKGDIPRIERTGKWRDGRIGEGGNEGEGK
jgi:hypothetical protein